MAECSLLSPGCASLPSRQFRALGTSAYVATTRPEAIATAEALLREELDEIDRACSRFRPYSEITRVHLAHGRPVVVSPLLGESVRLALNAAERTSGAIDPTVGAAMIGLGYDRDFAQLSEDDSSRPFRAQPAQGWRCIELDASNRLLRVPADVVVDLGATAKAYAADRAASRIAEVTGGGVLVNLGGDISARGASPDGWAIGLALDCATSPRDADAVVSIRGGGLASSGTTVRSWRHGARLVHHIIDPKTGDSAETCW
jgi:thiamine biosynthesis lipoprotein